MTSTNERFKKTIYHIAVSTIDNDSSMQEVFDLNAHLYRKTTLVCQADYDHLSIMAKKL